MCNSTATDLQTLQNYTVYISFQISFIDYLVYIPLFLSMHDGICDNPLNMSLNKYGPDRKVTEQRDMNPLGYPLKKQTAFMLRQQAEELLSGKKTDKEHAKKENTELLNKYSKYV